MHRRLSYFYDRIQPLGLKSPFKLSELRRLANSVCLGRRTDEPSRWIVVDEFGGGAEAIKELEDRPEYCLDLTFMYSLLSFGYELDEQREIVVSISPCSNEGAQCFLFLKFFCSFGIQKCRLVKRLMG